jgi:hypothetical protein
MNLYSIRDWDEHYEKAQTRKVGKVQWVPFPVKHDGKTFRRLLAMPKGLEVFGAWCLIVQVAAKCPARGVLADESGPLTAEDLALKTGASAKAMEMALSVLSNQRISWIVVSEYQRDTNAMAEDGERQTKSVELHDMTLQDRKEQDRKEQDRTPTPALPSPEVVVFEHWKGVMETPRSNLSDQRRKKIKARLAEGFSVDDLKLAVDGCRLTPFNMGINDRGEKFNDIELICRDSGHVERFRENALMRAEPRTNGSGTAAKPAPAECPRCRGDGVYVTEDQSAQRLCACAAGIRKRDEMERRYGPEYVRQFLPGPAAVAKGSA